MSKAANLMGFGRLLITQKIIWKEMEWRLFKENISNWETESLD
jgi:hypothetical protein